jgi:hypothetical protein
VAVFSHVLPKAIVAMVGANAVNLTTDTFTAGLCTGDSSAWTTGTVWGRQFASDITTAYTEIATVGTYTAGYAGRVALTTLTFTQQAATNDNIVSWTCTSPSPIAFGGGAASISARTMFINDKTAKSSAADTSSIVIVTVDFGVTVSSTAGAYTYTVAGTPNGLAFFTMS